MITFNDYLIGIFALIPDNGKSRKNKLSLYYSYLGSALSEEERKFDDLVKEVGEEETTKIMEEAATYIAIGMGEVGVVDHDTFEMWFTLKNNKEKLKRVEK